MLLIGSRAIRHFIPDFRPPQDWDLIGTEQEIGHLAGILRRVDEPNPRREKAHFHYGDRIVEVANSSELPYWDKVSKQFTNEPTVTDPVLGEMHVAPIGYLVITKQCGLIYNIGHWHKNLEDLYFLRDRVPTIPDDVATLLPHALDDSRRMFGAGHQRSKPAIQTCHPGKESEADDSSSLLEPELHRALHQRLALGSSPAVDEVDAWRAFPELDGETRRERMLHVFAEEAMVAAAQQYLGYGSQRISDDEGELTRWSLRMLITGKLPEGWRYFGVNYYREIRELIPDGWMAKLGPLLEKRRVYDQNCPAPGLDAMVPASAWDE